MRTKIYKTITSTAALASVLFIHTASFGQTIATVAGNYTTGADYTGDGGAATAATLNAPNDVVKDAAGNMYIADYNNNVIRKVNIGGIISTFAGTGTAGSTGDGGPATAATLNGPWGLAMDAAGNLYVSDYNNYKIRKITPGGVISTYAGTGTAGSAGDGGPATAAEIYRAVGICMDASNNLYIADSWNHKIRKVSAAGTMSTVAGNGTSGYSGDGAAATAAKLNYPYDVVVTTTGKVYIADYSNYVVREVTISTGNIATIAGNNSYGYSGDGSIPYLAQLSHPMGLAIDPSESKLYISDHENSRIRMVKMPPNILTYAGNGTGGYSGDGSAANAAKIKQSSGLFCDNNGNLYIADRFNQVIRMVTPVAYTISGATSMCAGTTSTLTPSVSGASWFSSNTAVATVDIASGVVTAVAPGTATIHYTDETGYGHVVVTVNAALLAITGTTTLCQGANTTLSNPTSGGTWTSGNTAIATAGAGTGVITGVAAGTSVISYSVGGCNVTTIVTVSPLANAGTISGTNNVCEANTVTLANTATGGTWSSSNITTATISATGLVTGVAAGTVTISYAATNSCGTNYATYAFTVNACPAYATTPGVITEGISVMPNPSTGNEVWIDLHTALDEPAVVVITDVTGVCVRTMTMSTNTKEQMHLDVPAGIYFISATTAHRHYVTKIILN